MARAGRDTELPPLLPAPRRAARLAGRLALREGLPIVLAPAASDGDFAAAVRLRDAVSSACGAKLAIEAHARVADLGPRIELHCEGGAGEAHRVAVAADGARLSAAGPAGLRYAVETLAQLVDPRGFLPACSIEDAPDFPRRGIMLDVSRGKVPTLATLHALVDLCVRLKLNVLMLYVEHTFRFRRHPEIGRGASPLDAGSLRELDAHAAACFVDLIPSLQSLGHMERILSIPRYAPLAETERRWTLSPAEPGSYQLLADLYDEFLPNFRSLWFNANCDEPFDLEQGKSRERARALGPGGVFLEHVERVRNLASLHGKQTMIWGDVVHAHPERIPEIPRELVLLDWWYEAEHDYDRVAKFAQHAIPFWVCPGTSTWNSLFPRIENSAANIARYAAAGRRHGARGLLVTDWGDFGHYNLLGNSWFGYAWAAQQAWSGGTPPRRFDRAFARSIFDDASGETARRVRALGEIHDGGFAPFNGSPLQFLYFDELERGFFVEGARAASLRRTLRRLDRERTRLRAARTRFRREALTWQEMSLALDASRHAVRKALAGQRYLAWRRRPAGLDAAARRRLAAELRGLATAQISLGRELRRLWLRRSEPDGFEITQRRLARSVQSLRRAARTLAQNRPPSPPPPHPGFSVATIFRALAEQSSPPASEARSEAEPSGVRVARAVPAPGPARPGAA
jgi:hexosaminidase